MTVSFWQDRSGQAHHEVKVLVVGAGISGASAAFWLARGGHDVAVVEAGEPCAGASGRSAGMLLLGTADPYARVADLYGRARAAELWAFTGENRALLQQHVLGDGALDGELRLVRRGTASASVSEHEQRELERSAQWMSEDGVPQQLLDREAAATALATRGVLGALRDPHGMTVDPRRLTARVLGLAEVAGARTFPHHAVFRLEHEEDGVRLWTTRATFRAQMVLLCTNAYAPLLDPHFDGKVVPTRGQMLATEPVPPTIPAGIYADFGYQYFWQLASGEVVAGGWRQHHADAEKGYSDETSSAVQSGVWEFLTRLYPSLAGARVTHRWAGVMGFAGDGLPFIGEIPGCPRVKYLCGHTGHGLGFAFLAARKLVAAALDGEPVGWLSARRLPAGPG